MDNIFPTCSNRSVRLNFCLSFTMAALLLDTLLNLFVARSIISFSENSSPYLFCFFSFKGLEGSTFKPDFLNFPVALQSD